MALTFFDLDGTLTRFDTFIPYSIIALFHRPWRILVIPIVLKGCIRFLRAKIGRQELKETFIGTFLGSASKEEVVHWNRVFISLFMPLITRKSILDKLRTHQKNGDKVYIVSASPDIYLEPISRRWKLDGLICTTLEWKEGYLTGHILGKNCRGEEKARRIRMLFSERELEGSFAYGNSDGDRELLELAHFGFKT